MGSQGQQAGNTARLHGGFLTRYRFSSASRRRGLAIHPPPRDSGVVAVVDGVRHHVGQTAGGAFAGDAGSSVGRLRCLVGPPPLCAGHVAESAADRNRFQASMAQDWRQWWHYCRPRCRTTAAGVLRAGRSVGRYCWSFQGGPTIANPPASCVDGSVARPAEPLSNESCGSTRLAAGPYTTTGPLLASVRAGR